LLLQRACRIRRRVQHVLRAVARMTRVAGARVRRAARERTEGMDQLVRADRVVVDAGAALKPDEREGRAAGELPLAGTADVVLHRRAVVVDEVLLELAREARALERALDPEERDVRASQVGRRVGEP